MDLIPEFIKRRHGEVKVEYEHPLLEPIAKGDVWHPDLPPEQVMQAAQLLGGIRLAARTRCGARWVRRRSRRCSSIARFSSRGCREKNKIPEGEANQIFDLLEKFAGFNKIARRRVCRRRPSDRVS